MTNTLPPPSPLTMAMPSTIPVPSDNSTVEVVTHTTIVLVSVTFTSTHTFPAAFPTTSDSGSTKGILQNTGAVAGIFTVVGFVGLVLLVFLTTCIIRCHRRRHIKFNREVFGKTAKTAHVSVLAFLNDKGGDRVGTKAKDIEDGLVSAGAEYAQGHGHQGRVYIDYTYAQPKQDNGHPNPANTTYDTIESPTSASTSTCTLYTYHTSTSNPSAPRRSASMSQEGHGKGRRDYRQLLIAAGLSTESRSRVGIGAGLGPGASGMSLIHENERYVFPNPYKTLQTQHFPRVQLGAGANAQA